MQIYKQKRVVNLITTLFNVTLNIIYIALKSL